jgi:DNA-binding IclR family transcriptional regulator
MIGAVAPASTSTNGPIEARSGAQSVERALAVLRCFERAPGSLGVSEIAVATGLSVSTAHRLVRALCAGGLLTQDLRTDRYPLEHLAEATGESVNLGIRSGAEVLVVLAVASSQPLRFDQLAGSRVPIHTSAMGKCLLAFAGPGADPLGDLPRLGRFTDRTITRRDDLLAALEQTRARGWALNDEERNRGVRAVAAPVLDANRAAVAAVAVQGPALRLPDDRLSAVADRIAETTTAIGPVLAATG